MPDIIARIKATGFHRLLFLLFITVTLLIAIIALQQQQNLRQRAGGGDPATLTLSPASATAYIGEPLSVDVILQAATNDVTGVDITIGFNSAILAVNKFVPTDIFNAELISKINSDGTFRYVATNTDTNKHITGDVKLGTLVLQPSALGQADIKFTASQVTALYRESGVETTMQNGTYVVTVPTTPTQVVTPTSSPTATPIPTDIPTPTPVVPQITSITPLQAIPGTRITILGENFLLEGVPGSSGNVYLVQSDGTETKLASLLDGATDPNGPNSPIWGEFSITFTLGNLPSQSGKIKVTIGNVFAISNETFAILSAPTATPIPTNTPIPPTTIPAVLGDANGDRVVDILDYNIWRSEFLGSVTTKTSDFNKDDKVDLLDFNIWRSAFNDVSTPTTAPTVAPTNTPVPPTATRVPSPTPTPDSINAFSVPFYRIFVGAGGIGGGNLGGLSGADQKCQTLANSVYEWKTATWKAWLSDNNTSANSRLVHGEHPYRLVDIFEPGPIIANNWNDLTDGTINVAIDRGAFGGASNAKIWTRTTTNGSISDAGFDLDTSCNNWTSNSASLNARTGFSSAVNSRWTLDATETCNNQAGLYCIEQTLEKKSPDIGFYIEPNVVKATIAKPAVGLQNRGKVFKMHFTRNARWADTIIPTVFDGNGIVFITTDARMDGTAGTIRDVEIRVYPQATTGNHRGNITIKNEFGESITFFANITITNP